MVFTHIATQYRDNKGAAPATIIAAADIHVGDFGQHKVVASWFSCDRAASVPDANHRPVRCC